MVTKKVLPGKLDNHVQENKIGPLFYTTTKINLKWVKYLSIRPETIESLEENAGKKLLDIGISNGFFRYICKLYISKGVNIKNI